MEEQIKVKTNEVQLQEKLLKEPDVADILNISKSLAYQLVSHGDLQSLAIGEARRVRPQDLTSCLKAALDIQP